MNQQDKDRLRELAKRSGVNDWRCRQFERACTPELILSLLEENEALAKDAARYRWVRTAGAWDSEIGLNSKTPEQYDAEVDAAMQHKGD